MNRRDCFKVLIVGNAHFERGLEVEDVSLLAGNGDPFVVERPHDCVVVHS